VHGRTSPKFIRNVPPTRKLFRCLQVYTGIMYRNARHAELPVFVQIQLEFPSCDDSGEENIFHRYERHSHRCIVNRFHKFTYRCKKIQFSNFHCLIKIQILPGIKYESPRRYGGKTSPSNKNSGMNQR
jgi:hypothetical protein